MGWLKWIIGAADWLPKIKEVAEVFVGNKRERDATLAANEHDEQIELHKEQSAGYTYAVTNRTWFDVFIDGLNRLPRPVMTLGVIWLVVWAARDPGGFTVTMGALNSLPEWLSTILTVIIVFWFGSRTIAKDIPEQVAAARVRQTTKATSAQAPVAKRNYDTADDNDVIDAWRKRAAGQ
jgi:hypothetical protein